MSSETIDDYQEGYLTKKGRIRRNWKKRWCILEKGEIKYYTSKPLEKDKERPQGIIPVKNILCGPTRHIRTQVRIYYLFASSPEELAIWKEKLIKNGGLWDPRIERISFIREDGDVIEEKDPLEEIISDEPINLEQESLYTIYKAFRGIARIQDFKILELYLATEERQELDKILSNLSRDAHGTFWKFFDYPPFQRVTYVSESKSLERGELQLRFNTDDEKSQKSGRILFIKENGRWYIEKEDWSNIV